MPFSVLMLSGDRTAFSDGPFRTRLLAYAKEADVTVLITGTGDAKTESLGPLSLVFPGGTSRAVNFFRLLRAARGHSKAVSVVTAQDPYFTGLVGLYAAWGRAPLQIQVHGPLFDPAFVRESVRHRVESLVARVVLPLASCVRVVSEKTRATAARATAAPITVLPVSVDTAQFQRAYPRPEEFGAHPVVLAVSRLSREKAIPLMLDALKQIPHTHLYIAGDGPERATIVAHAERLGLTDRVHLLGFKNPIAPYLQHASVVLHTSHYESYCLTLVEAVLSKAPVVTTDVGVARELPPEMVAIVPADPTQIAAALTRVIEHPPEERVRDTAARVLSATVHTGEETARRFLESLRTCGAS